MSSGELSVHKNSVGHLLEIIYGGSSYTMEIGKYYKNTFSFVCFQSFDLPDPNNHIS